MHACSRWASGTSAFFERSRCCRRRKRCLRPGRASASGPSRRTRWPTGWRGSRQGELLDAASSKKIFEYLDTDPSRLRIARRFPPSDLWAGKTGSMSGVRNDSGILRTKKGRFVLAVFTDGSQAEGWGPDHPSILAIAELSRVDRRRVEPGPSGRRGETAVERAPFGDKLRGTMTRFDGQDRPRHRSLARNRGGDREAPRVGRCDGSRGGAHGRGAGARGVGDRGRRRPGRRRSRSTSRIRARSRPP